MPRRKKTGIKKAPQAKEAEEIQAQKDPPPADAPVQAADEEIVDPDVRWVAPKKKRKMKHAAVALDWELVKERWLGDGDHHQEEHPQEAQGAKRRLRNRKHY